MDIGRLKHRITFQKLQQTKNEYGEMLNEWLDFKTVWAEIKPVSGRQFFSAKQINSEISHTVYMRYNPQILPNMRIKYNNRIFDVLYVMNVDEGNSLLQIYCKEVISYE